MSKLEQLKPKIEGVNGLNVETIVEGKIWRVDVNSLLEQAHSHWSDEMMKVALTAPEVTIQGGAVYTSLEGSDFKTIYHPTDKLKIEKELPWLNRLFEEDFCSIVAELTGDSTVYLGKDRHALNMNLSRGRGKKYEKHIDRNKWTFLLGVSTMEEGEGGRTLFYDKVYSDTPIEALRPQKGIGVVFYGKMPHKVEEMLVDKDRLVAPGDIYTEDVPEVEDEDFNKTILT